MSSLAPSAARSFGLLLLTIPLAVACSAPPSSGDTHAEIGSARAAIQGGELAPAASLDFAVALVGRGLCSGTLIAPNLAITARHCVEVDPEGTPPCSGGALMPPSELRLVVGKEVAQGASSYAVTKIITAPETNGCVPDLALVQLAKPIPASVVKPARPAVDIAFRSRPHYIPTVTAIGFGVDDVGEAGVRRIRRDIKVLCVPGDSEFDCGADVDDFIKPFEMVAGPGACQGDSGGGLYEPAGVEKNDAVVVSVVSRGGIEEDGTCVEGLYVRVDAFHELLITTGVAAAAAGNYPVPVWAGGTDISVPSPPPPPAPVEETPPNAAPPPPAPTSPPMTTTTSGCAAAPSGAGSPSSIVPLSMLALALAARRRKRSTHLTGT